MNLHKSNTIGEMITTVNMFYVTNVPVGPLTKKLMIVGLKGSISLNDKETEEKLLNCDTFGQMLDVVKNKYGSTKVLPHNKDSAVKGFNSALIMTRCKKK
jgi:hypothetical protein